MNIPNFKFFNKDDPSLVRKWLFRGLGLVYFIAFFSLWSQIDGLFLSKGILPISNYIHNLIEALGNDSYFRAPTLFYMYSGDYFIKGCLLIGILLSILLFLGRATVYMLSLVWILYLSFVNTGQDFMSFQWDVLLLEVGFIAILMAPINIGRFKLNIRPPIMAIWAMRVVLFRVMIASALVKWMSGDLTWHHFTALDYHYWTQPLPHFLSWYVDKLPGWFHIMSVGVMFIIEGIIPFFIFFGKKARIVAGILIAMLMELIFWTGNYGFFNILVIVICITLVDEKEIVLNRKKVSIKKLCSGLIPIGLIICGLSLELARFTPYNYTQRQLAPLSRFIQPFHLVNGYGLFANMTTKRDEIIIEGSDDGKNWKTYEFKFKPGDIKRAPQWVQPHQPRLDWQMWFAALSTYDRQHWYLNFLFKLLKNEREVTSLLLKNPFQNQAPKYIRSQRYSYTFNSYEKWKESGQWWQRDYISEYAPVVQLK